MTLWWRGLRSGLLVGWLLSSGMARAAVPVHVELVWSDAAGCPAPAQFDDQVARLVNEAELSTELPQFAMQVRAVSKGLELVARGRVGSREAQRTVTLASCGEVQEAAILLVAMTLAPAAFEAPPPPSAPAPAPAQPPAAVTKAPSSDIGLGLLLAGSADFLSLPAPSGGPALGLQLALRRWRIGLEARYFFPRSQAGLGAPARATVGLTAFAFSTGLRWTFGDFGLGPQAELEAGFLRGQTTGVDGGGVRRALWLAGLLGLVAEYSVNSRIGFQLAGSGGAPFWRPRFALEGERAFFTTPPAIFRMLFGMYVWLDTKD